jgi:hypothetical protein
MEKIIGRIEKKAEAKTKTGAPYLTFTVDGKNYNSFEPEHSKFQIGDVVELELEQKGQYKNLVSMKSSTEQPQIAQQKAPQGTYEVRHDLVLTRVEKPHSYEFGKATARHKIYYSTVEELKAHIEALRESGFIEAQEELPPQ